MKTVSILENEDKIRPDDWCRPLQVGQNDFGDDESMNIKGCYGGTLINNLKWVLRETLGLIVKRSHYTLKNYTTAKRVKANNEQGN